MNFFDSQDAARRSTGRLVGLFVLAVVLIVVLVYLAVALFLTWLQSRTGPIVPAVWSLGTFAGVAAVTLIVIVTGSVYKIASLSEGGPVVARLLGARPVDPNTPDLAERRLLNVVEEMAIASGIPVPAVVVLDGEAGINAFAAGFSPSDTVIGVTRGCLNHLTRDELQGVIAHEFSHALNGDMRLNLRLMGVLHGLLLIALIGYWLARADVASDSRKGSGPLLVLGLAVLGIGSVGMFFGRLIKSGVSRQRELLGDASAVQFTRNPASIAGALKKIGGLAEGSRIGHPRAEEASHLFFGAALSGWLADLLATHPPLLERIQRLEPQFDGHFPEVEPISVETVSVPPPPPAAAPEGLVPALAAPATPPPALAPPTPPPVPTPPPLDFGPEQVVAAVGAVSAAHVAYAASFVAALPPTLQRAVREPATACALVFGLLLDRDREVRRAQLDALGATVEAGLYLETLNVMELADACPTEARLPLLDIALATLRRLSAKQYEAFRASVERLIAADARVTLFEFTLQRVLLRHLDPYFRKLPVPEVAYGTVRAVVPYAGLLLSVLAHAGQGQEERAAHAFGAGVRQLGFAGDGPALLPRAQCGLVAVDRALAVLAKATPQVKRQLLEACTVTIAYDRRVTIQEAELLRAIADSLDCPIPPFLPGEALA